MSQPAHRAAGRRERAIFLLTLVTVVVAASLAGYLLGQYAFSRWVGWSTTVPATPGSPGSTSPQAGPGYRPGPAVAGSPYELSGRLPGGVEGPQGARSVPGSPPVAAQPAPGPRTPPGAAVVGGGSGGEAVAGPERVAPAPAAASGQAPSVPVGPEGQDEEAVRREGYFVQVGAFQEAERAWQAVQQLQRAGYPVRLIRPQGAQPGRSYYKVWVGPYRDREQAVAARERLRAEWPGAWIP